MSKYEKLSPIQYFILKVISCSNKPIKGKVLLQKLAFLIFQNFDKIFSEAYFIKHKLGPYSAVVEKITDELIYMGYVAQENELFSVTSSGINTFNEFESSIPVKKIEDFSKICEQIKNDFYNFNSKEILAYIYKEFPSYREQSIVDKDLDYEKIFYMMYKSGKLGISKIAELLGWSVDETYDFLKDNNKYIRK